MLGGGGIQPIERMTHRRTLVLAQLVLGEMTLGSAAKILEEFRIDHRATDELLETLRHDARMIPPPDEGGRSCLQRDPSFTLSALLHSLAGLAWSGSAVYAM